MKKISTILILLFVLLGSLNATQVDEHTAKLAGQRFLRYKAASSSLNNPGELTLVYSSTSNIVNPMPEAVMTTYFYVFNTANGFVIVSGDDCVVPVLGYSDQKAFRPDNIAPAVAKWLEGYKGQIRYAIENNLPATDVIKQAWAELIGTSGDIENSSGGRSSVPPLVQTTWDQPYPYNELCPGGSVTGCVATAMAQVMKYWNYPEQGMGFHSFNHQNYGTLSANFGSTTYSWGNMPNSITGSNNAIATLMYHCGVSVDMGYSPEVSGAWVIENSPTPQACSEYAFKNYFGYSTDLRGIERVNYSDAQWESVIKQELDASRPVLYDGFGNGGGHAFVCDGYDNNDFFHFNWGWSGYYDGYFETHALNPGGTGTGGGTGGYNSGQQAIIGVEPPEGGGGGGGGDESFDLKLYDFLTASDNTLDYGQAFSVFTNIWNDGTGTFTGDYGAAVFDVNYNFIDFIEIKSGWTLEAGYVYTNGLEFYTDGLMSMLPGTYYVGVFYRPTDEEWSIVGDGDYLNFLQIEVMNAGDLELYSDIVIAQGTTLTKGKPVSVNLNILNDGSSTFYGTYSVDLYDLDGYWIETIMEINEPNGLPPGYLYLDPYLTFHTPSLQAEPGTYLLALTHLRNGGDWELTGSSYFQNPIYVNVKAPALQPDIYEDNNSVGNAYTFPITFSGNAGSKKTTGSDCHTGNDYDFYKINLPAGFDYTINARMHDSYNSGNGNVYTLDGQFSYSFDGVKWSDAYDDVLPGEILVQNGGTVYFFATPYFLGQTGSYLLDMNITRTPLTGTKELDLSGDVRIYPNPAVDMVNVEFSETDHSFSLLQLVDMRGQVIYSAETKNKDVMTIPVGNIANGTYAVRMQTENGFAVKQVTVHK